MADMVAGNPRANRKGLCVAIACLLIALLSIALIALLRKRTNPQKEPPLHPANSIATAKVPGTSMAFRVAEQPIPLSRGCFGGEATPERT